MLMQAFSAAQFGGINDIVPITMGQSGANVYSVTTNTGAYILRIHDEDDASWRNAILMQEVASPRYL